MTDRQTIRNSALAILACLLWSTAVVTAKHALAYQTPLVLAGLRFILAGLLLVPLSGGIREPFRLLRHEFKTVFLVSAFHTVYLYATFFLAMTMVRGAEATIMIGSGPLASALVAHLMMRDDRMNRQTLLSLLFGIGGIVLVSLSSNPWNPSGLREFLGLMLLLSGSFVSAVGNVTVARRRGALHPVALCSAQMLLGGPILLLLGLAFEGLPDLAPPPRFYALLLWLSVISAAGFSIWFYLLARVRVSRLNLWKFLIPLSGAVLSWLLLPGESPTPYSLGGMLLIVCGIILGQREPPAQRAPAAPAASGARN